MQCYDLIAGPTGNATWKLGCAAFVDYEGKELATFAAAVAYTETTGRDVYVWWEGLEWKEPDDGWRGTGRIEIPSAPQAPPLLSSPHHHHHNQHRLYRLLHHRHRYQRHPLLNPFLRMVSAESVIMGKLRGRWCTVESVHVLTMYHASSTLVIGTLARDHMHAMLAMYRRSGWVLSLHARWLVKYAQHAKTLSWSKSRTLPD